MTNAQFLHLADNQLVIQILLLIFTALLQNEIVLSIKVWIWSINHRSLWYANLVVLKVTFSLGLVFPVQPRILALHNRNHWTCLNLLCVDLEMKKKIDYFSSYNAESRSRSVVNALARLRKWPSSKFHLCAKKATPIQSSIWGKKPMNRKSAILILRKFNLKM